MFSRSIANRKRVVQACTTTCPGYISAATLDQLWQYLEAPLTAVPQGHIQSLFDSMSKRLAAVTANNGG
ncbi:hypothetical protein TNCV_2773011 [Trichonephila clavipes]|nr:hypothetical protein TNCV_2773011 [Trichonephila clavipes]